MDDEAIGALHAKGCLRITLCSRQPLLFWRCDGLNMRYCIALFVLPRVIDHLVVIEWANSDVLEGNYKYCAG